MATTDESEGEMDLVTVTFPGQESVRHFVDADGKSWFHLGDVCVCLGLKNSRMVAKTLRDNGFGAGVNSTYARNSRGENRLTNFVRRDALCGHVIPRSNSEFAGKFQRWLGKVADQVIETGGYSTIQPSRQLLIQERALNLEIYKILRADYPDDQRILQFTLDLLINATGGLAITDGGLTLAEFVPDRVGQKLWSRYQQNIGRGVARWYRKHYEEPKKTTKYCNGQQRPINVFPHHTHNAILEFVDKQVEIYGWKVAPPVKRMNSLWS
jgi:prophage antirepressor-like protein